MYTYFDIIKRYVRKTRGVFIGWERRGALQVWYAVFATRSMSILVPPWCLTRETKAAIMPRPENAIGEHHGKRNQHVG